MPRIQIGREAVRALKIAAAMRDMRPHELMEELIMRHCGQMAMKPDEQVAIKPDSHMVMKPEPPLDSEKIASRKTSPPEESAREGRPWHGGPPPYEEQHPETAARVLAMWAGGAKKAGWAGEQSRRRYRQRAWK